MKRSLFRSCSIAAVLVAGLALALPGHAADTSSTNPPPGPPKAGSMLRALARELDLTPDQRGVLKDLIRRNRPVLRPLVAELKVERRALRELVAVAPLDEAALAAQADRMATLNRELIIASTRFRADLRKVLTPDQLAKLEHWRAHAAGRTYRGRTTLPEWLDVP